jgi:tetratricopeptide (TPR) repeat protein
MLLPRSAVRVALSITLSTLPLASVACFASPENQPRRSQPQSQKTESLSASHSNEKDLLRQAAAVYHQGDRTAAERLLKKVLSLDPNNADANFSLGAIAEERGDLAGALSYYQAAHTANSADREAAEAISSIQDKLHRQSLSSANRGNSEPSTPLSGHVDTLAAGVETDFQRGIAAKDAGRTDEAMAFFQRALQQNPHELQAMIAMGEIYSRRGQHVPALACYQMSLKENSSDPRLKAAVELEANSSGLSGSVQEQAATRQKTQFAANIPEQPKGRRSTSRALVGLCSGVLQVAACVGVCHPSRHLYYLWHP